MALPASNLLMKAAVMHLKCICDAAPQVDEDTVAGRRLYELQFVQAWRTIFQAC